ncbi:MAG: GNAT family N-acetyltransferase [Cellulosilyticaceae bacterium]
MKNIEVLSTITDKEITNILGVWESSVRATHLFLTEENIVSLRPCVEEGVKFISNLAVIRDQEDAIQAFIGVQDNKIEMLFVNDDYRGKGLGKQLVSWAINSLNIKFVDVNEQNEQGLGFYKHMGFGIFDRSELDEQGNPFPILYMKL